MSVDTAPVAAILDSIPAPEPDQVETISEPEKAPEELAGFDRLENHVRYLGVSLN